MYLDLQIKSTMTKKAQQHRCTSKNIGCQLRSLQIWEQGRKLVVYKPQDPSHGVPCLPVMSCVLKFHSSHSSTCRLGTNLWWIFYNAIGIFRLQPCRFIAILYFSLSSPPQSDGLIVPNTSKLQSLKGHGLGFIRAVTPLLAFCVTHSS